MYWYWIVLVLAASMVLPLHLAEASHVSEGASWQLVMLSSYPACSNYHYQTMNKYDSLTEQYLTLYEFPNQNHAPVCLPIDEYNTEYLRPQNLDLVVIVLDKNLGEKQLHELKMGGLYTHQGEDRRFGHAVIICDCPNFDYSDPVWILTHELSHFILYYLDYDREIIEDKIHSYDKEYDECRKHYTPDCKDIITKLRVDDVSYSYSVMPVYEPAVNEQYYNSTASELSAEDEKLSKMLTQWWMEGRLSQEEYQKSLSLAGYQMDDAAGKSVVFHDDPITADTTWKDLIGYKQTDFDLANLLSLVP